MPSQYCSAMTEVSTPEPGTPAGLLTEEQARVLGCLIEKSHTTPDDYPLTANALMRACNQTTSRDPVVNYDLHTVERVVAELKSLGLARFVHMASGRAVTKYRHVADERLGLDSDELKIVGLLLLRGAQTVSELKTRSERWGGFASLEAVLGTLQRLADRPEGWVVRIERQTGQREDRWTHAFCGAPVMPSTLTSSAPAGGRASGSVERVEALEARVAELAARVERLTAELAEVRSELGFETTPAGGTAAPGSPDDAVEPEG